MDQQNGTSTANLKRQLTFLKTIDQKLEGMRRENERLLRLADNPRVVFSRSSLAGLYRIVNSLISAGPMYGLESIENWAKVNRDRLVVLGKRGGGPTPEEMEQLQLTIGELGRLRDEAMEAVKKALKTPQDGEPESEGEPETEAAEADVETDGETELTIETEAPLEKDEGDAAKAANDAAAPKTQDAEPGGFPFMNSGRP